LAGVVVAARSIPTRIAQLPVDSMVRGSFCYNFVLPEQRCGRLYDFTFRQKRAGTDTPGKTEGFGQ
jgi:hypothetical protein